MATDIPIPENCRGFFDPLKLRSWLFENARDAFQHKLNTLETEEFKVKVDDIKYTEHQPFSLKDQKNTILERRDLTVPLKGTVSLISKKTGDVVDKKNVTLASVPYITERNTAIYNGSEYIPTNQARLKEGVYSRVRQTGEAEAFLNVKKGTGMNGRIEFNPKTQIFMYTTGASNFHLYSLLKDFGISDSSIENAWGKEIYLKNKSKYDSSVIDKLYDKIFSYKQ